MTTPRSCVDCVHHTIYECQFSFSKEDHAKFIPPVIPDGLTLQESEMFELQYHAKDCKAYEVINND